MVGSYAYNATMTLGAAAVITPLRIADVAPLRAPLVAMLVAMVVVVLLAARRRALGRGDAVVLLAGYVVFVVLAVA